MAGAGVGASMWRLLLLVLLCLLVMAEPRCETGDGGIVRRAFSSVSGFNDGLYSSIVGGGCEVRKIKLPGKNLTGAVSWMSLTNLSSLEVVDLSMNMLKGSVPGRFWSMPSLQHVNLAGNRIGGMVRYEIRPNSSSSSLSKLHLLNLSDNRFTNSIHLAGFSSLQTLDLSRNDLRSLPYGLDNLTDLKYLDLSGCNISGSASRLSKLKSLVYLDVSKNAMNGSFPSDFPSLHSIHFLNISMNNFTISSENATKFSPSAFIEAGIAVFLKSPPPPSPDLNRRHRRPSTGGDSSRMKAHNSTETHKLKSNRRRHKALIIGSASSAATVAAIAALCLCLCSRRRRIQRKKKKWAITKPQPPFPAIRAGKYASGPFSFETESGTWVAEVKDPASAPVVMFEKPLMRLTFSDLLAATSGFGRESQLAEPRRGGPVYRAVLPGDVHVAIKVLDRVRDIAADSAAGMFEELADVRHPNLLPLAGYCIAGTV